MPDPVSEYYAIKGMLSEMDAETQARIEVTRKALHSAFTAHTGRAEEAAIAAALFMGEVIKGIK